MNHRRPFHRALLATIAAVGLASAAAPAWAQSGGAPLRIVVPYPPGGSSDRAARLLAETLQPRLGRTVIVENIVGAGGRLALRQLAALPDDAPVLVLANPALMVVAPLVYKNNGYDPDKDFQPVAQVSRYEFAAAVGPAVPVRALSHLMAWLKANPDQASIGVPATGSLPHFFALMMAQSAQVQAQVVGYKGSAPLGIDLVGGHLPVAVDTLDALLPLHEGGKLRILATSGGTRAVKDLPTFREAGFPLSASGWNVLYARAGLPAAQVERFSAEVATVMKQPDIRDKFIALKAEPVSATRDETTTMLRAFKAQWVPVIRNAGLQFD
jgi:tripartite-type tricarboxylate transporter receptor subunit TctC